MAPDGWRAPGRQLLLSEILRELFAGREQFPFIDDVVPVEDASRLVAGEHHRDTLRNRGTYEVSRSRSSAVVKNPTGHARFLAGDAERRAPDSARHSVALEYERDSSCSSSLTTFENGREWTRNRLHLPLRASKSSSTSRDVTTAAARACLGAGASQSAPRGPSRCRRSSE